MSRTLISFSLLFLVFSCQPDFFFPDLYCTSCETELETNLEDGQWPFRTAPYPDDYVPDGFELVYETDFEGVQKIDDHLLDWDFPHWFEFAAQHTEDGGEGDGEGGGYFWVDSIVTHGGQASIGIELFDIEQSRRAEFILYPDEILEKEYFVSYWLFVPGTFGLFNSEGGWDWFEIFNPFHSGGLPYGAFILTDPDSTQDVFNLSMLVRKADGASETFGDIRKELVKERWVRVAFYVKRDPVDGAVKVWYDGYLLVDQEGIPTENPELDEEDFNISIAKVYHERLDDTPHQIWVDDLEIYTLDEED